MSVTLRLSVDGLDKTINRLGEAAALIEVNNLAAMTDAVLFLEATVKDRTPRVTGRLFSSIQGEVFDSSHGRVGTNVHYAPFVEVGRGPIVAEHLTRRGHPGFLRFRSRGRWIFRRSVGPAAGRRMFLEGLADSAEAIKERFRQSVREALKGR